TLGIFIAGVFAGDIRDFGALTHSAGLRAATRTLYYLLPNFHNFNVIGIVAHGQSISLRLVGLNSLYAAVYVTVILLASAASFSGRNLK
ncbi:MAG: hypothetical protein ACRD41_17225, partial [Candidatus Acidiferrales bacterium]